jgi:trigger factor
VKSAVESLEPTKVKLTVEVASEDFKPALSQAYKEISKKINVPGFRRGKVPPRIIDQRVGRGVVLAEAMEDSLNEWYREALKEHDLFPMDQPEVDLTREPDVEASQPDFEFTATVEVRPEIVIPDLSQLKVTVEAADATEEEVDEALDQLRERFSSLKTVDRPAQTGDFVTLDLKAEIDGEEIDSVSGISYQIGRGNMLDGMDEALEGLSAQEATTFNSPLAGGARQGEEALVWVELQAVKERELPIADDEFALMASEFDTIDELRDGLRGVVVTQKQRQQVDQAKGRLVQQLLGSLDFPAPPGVVAKDAERRMEQAGKDKDDAEVRAEFVEDSTRAVREQLLLDALVRHLKVSANETELLDFLTQMAQAYGIAPMQFVASAQQSGELPGFYSELIRQKAQIAALLQVTVEDKEGNPVDVKSLVTTPEAGAPAEGGADGSGDSAGEWVVDSDLEEVAIDVDSLAADAAQSADAADAAPSEADAEGR